MDTGKITRYGLIALAVIIIAGLAGWFFMLRGQTRNVTQADAARGFDSATPQASSNGSTFTNDSAAGDGTSPGTGGVLPSQPGVTYTGTAQAGDTHGVNLPISSDWTSNGPGTGSSTLSRYKTPRLWHIQKLPIAGYGFVKSATTTPQIYFVERSTGYLFSANADTGALVRVSNTLLPKTYEAIIASDGASLLRSPDNAGGITTFSATSTKVSADGTPQTLKGTALDKNISSISAQPGQRNIFYIQDQGDKSVGYTAYWDGTRKKQVFGSILGDWRTFYLADGEFDIEQKPEDGVPGYAYRIENSGHLTPRVRNVPGLTFLPKSNSPVLLYGSSDGNIVSLFSRANDGARPVVLAIKTAADKCVWTGTASFAYCAVPALIPEKNYLHNRYLGMTHTEDTWWKVDAATGTASFFFSDRAPGESGIDVQSPVIDPSGNFILFKNATDQSLWLLRIPL